MNNLQYYQENSFEFYINVLSRKRDSDLKSRLGLIRDEISTLYDRYESHFNNNDLAEINNTTFTDIQRQDLLSLYRYKSQLFEELKTILTTTETNRINDTCQNCTINKVNSFDHIIPKEEFPQFAANPLNLFPSCTQCNGKKSTNWRDENGEFRFLNLYLDNLPENQYLFVDVEFEGVSIKPNFRLEQGSLSDDIYGKINRHYSDLDLFKRFRLAADSVITELMNLIQGNRGFQTDEELKTSTERTEERNKLTFGHNFWESILRETLVNEAEFWDIV